MSAYPPLPPKPKRPVLGGWCRLFDDFTGNKKWRLVAAQSGVPLDRVHSIVIAMFNQANKRPRSAPRGSLEEFSVEECAIALDVPPEDVARVYTTLQNRGWIDDQDFISKWYLRQPDSEDPTAKDRQRRSRANRKEELESFSPSRVTPPADAALPAQDGKLAANQARRWLFQIGAPRVAILCDMTGAVADSMVRKWLVQIEGDAAALSVIVSATIDKTLVNDEFRNAIESQIARHLEEKHNGPKLNFGPLVLRGGRS